MSQGKETVAFVFARGGSKGIPKKNLEVVGDKTLVGHAVDAARRAATVDRVLVSTDDPDIASAARGAGAEVPFLRPDDLAADDTPEIEAWRHAIRAVRGAGQSIESFVSVPPTSPLRLPKDIDDCVRRLHRTPADVVITAREAQRNPYFNMVEVDDDGWATLVADEERSVNRRQEAPDVFDLTTVAYAAQPSYVLETDSLLAGDVRIVEVPQERSLDIDTPTDLEIVRSLYEHRRTKGSTTDA